MTTSVLLHTKINKGLDALYEDPDFEQLRANEKFRDFMDRLVHERPEEATAFVGRLRTIQLEELPPKLREAVISILWAIRGTSFNATFASLKRDGLM